MEEPKVAMNNRLFEYLLSVSLRENGVLKKLRDETAKDPMSVLQISPDQGQFMALLVKLMGATRVLEVGTFTGYSALSMALALPEEGQLVTLDINKQWTDMARRYWQQAGVAEKIRLYLAPALDTMDSLLTEGQAEQYDIIFIDADKTNYGAYYETGLRLLRTGGLILLDNVLWRGKIIDETIQDADTKALRELNTKVYSDERVDISMIQIGDGMTMIYKR